MIEKRLEDVEKRLYAIEQELANHIRSDLKFLRYQLWGLLLGMVGLLMVFGARH
jgi:hypothetical protein